jgi:hypothetical protein
VHQIEETRRMKILLERRLLEANGEYEALRSPISEESRLQYLEGEDKNAYEHTKSNGRTSSFIAAPTAPPTSDVVEDEEEYEKHICTDPTHLSNVEHTAALTQQRRTFGEEIEELKRVISSLNTRVESLVLELARREGENASLRGLVERREGALQEAVELLEAERREREAEREREVRVREVHVSEGNGEGKPMVSLEVLGWFGRGLI